MTESDEGPPARACGGVSQVEGEEFDEEGVDEGVEEREDMWEEGGEEGGEG